MHILELNEEDKTTILYNYKYSSSEGWKKLEFCNETPLDFNQNMLYGSQPIANGVIELIKVPIKPKDNQSYHLTKMLSSFSLILNI